MGALCPHRASLVLWEHIRIRAECGQGRVVNGRDFDTEGIADESPLYIEGGIELLIVSAVEAAAEVAVSRGVGSEGPEVSGGVIRPGGVRGDVLVGEDSIMDFIRVGTELGVTLLMMVNAGRRRTVVAVSLAGRSSWSESGTGILVADSMSFWDTC